MAHDSHRIRLTDDELELIVASMNARLAMTGPRRRERMLRLMGRLRDVAPGNPNWRLGGTEGYPVETDDDDDV